MKILKYLGIGLLVFGAVFATLYFIKTNSKPLVEYDIQYPKIQSIEKKTVVTGTVIPEDDRDQTPDFGDHRKAILSRKAIWLAMEICWPKSRLYPTNKP